MSWRRRSELYTRLRHPGLDPGSRFFSGDTREESGMPDQVRHDGLLRGGNGLIQDWETWLVEDAGHSIIEKKASVGLDSLSPAERLTYCLWVTDYSMRNAGDLQTASDLYPAFQVEAANLARNLHLQMTSEIFQMETAELESSYFNRFDAVCAEVSRALTAT